MTTEKKKRERYYTTIPKYVTRVVARQPKRELVGWGFEVRDGMGALIAWSTVIYKTPEEAYQQARERFGECDHEFEQVTLIPWARGVAWVLSKFTNAEPTPGAWKCAKCDEQGYEIQDTGEIRMQEEVS